MSGTGVLYIANTPRKSVKNSFKESKGIKQIQMI